MRYLIVGNGVAGITAAAELASRHAGQIDVYSAERHPYYFRPQLPRFLAGEVPPDKLYARPPSWYEERAIAVHLEIEVVRLLPGRKRVILSHGDEVPYDRLLLAVGGSPYVPPIEGLDRQGVFTLRTIDDALRIREYAAHCQETVVIGGGLLGLEAARGLTALGLTVSTLEVAPRLCPRQLDDDGAAVFQRQVEGLGIRVALNAETVAVVGDGTVRGVVLRDGREFPAQMVLVASGVKSNATLAAEAGLRVDQGIVVDEHMRTSAPDVYSAGDSACFHGRSWGIIPQARAQAQVAAANMAGHDTVYEEIVPATTLKIVGIELRSVGTVMPQKDTGFEEMQHCDMEEGLYSKIVMKDGALVGAIVLGDHALGRKLEGLVVGRARMSRDEARRLLER